MDDLAWFVYPTTVLLTRSVEAWLKSEDLTQSKSQDIHKMLSEDVGISRQTFLAC